MVPRAATARDGERSPWSAGPRSPTIDTMTTERPEIDTPTDDDAAAAKREERQGWLLLTGIFVVGGLLVVLAAMVT
ncbi:hypothetical protein DSM104299_01407 [Baekduia alba]|nr:hypothetical protein DSM104299_01407 [Baekduia alba]